MKLLEEIFIVPIRIYQRFISPLLGSNCRYVPTCSTYMMQAIREWGIFLGIYMGIRRIFRCHPWGSHGYDPVPINPKKQKNQN